MTENVLVYITGYHYDFENEDTVQTIQPGTYRFIGGKHIIRYEELLDESKAGPPVTADCLIKITKDRVTLTKRGDTQTEMFFAEGSHFPTIYQTPVGSLQLTIHTNRLAVTEAEDLIQVEIKYDLEWNGSTVSQCRIQIEIKAKK